MDVEPGLRVIPADSVLPDGAARQLATTALTRFNLDLTLARRFWVEALSGVRALVPRIMPNTWRSSSYTQ